eukprot:1320974-Amphidinium_carterae.1
MRADAWQWHEADSHSRTETPLKLRLQPSPKVRGRALNAWATRRRVNRSASSTPRVAVRTLPV